MSDFSLTQAYNFLVAIDLAIKQLIEAWQIEDTAQPEPSDYEEKLTNYFRARNNALIFALLELADQIQQESQNSENETFLERAETECCTQARRLLAEILNEMSIESEPSDLEFCYKTPQGQIADRLEIKLAQLCLDLRGETSSLNEADRLQAVLTLWHLNRKLKQAFPKAKTPSLMKGNGSAFGRYDLIRSVHNNLHQAYQSIMRSSLRRKLKLYRFLVGFWLKEKIRALPWFGKNINRG